MGVFSAFFPEFFLSLSSIVLLVFNIFFINNFKNRYLIWLSFFLISTFLFLVTPSTLQLHNIDGNFINSSGLFYLRIFIFFSLCLIYLSSYNILIKSPYLNEFSFFLGITVSFLSFLLSSTNFLIAFVLIESISFAFYLLVSFYRNNLLSVEAGLKYFYLGTFSSLIFLTGLFLIYYSTLSFSFGSISEILSSTSNSNIYTIGLLLIFLSLVFKLGGAPLQFWLPEVYQGSPFIVFPLLISISKLAFGVFLANVYYLFLVPNAFYINMSNIKILFFIVSLLSMLIGNLLALKQNEVKRLLAYSSIAHVGYFMSLLSLDPNPMNYHLLCGYLFIYALTNLALLVTLQLNNINQLVKISFNQYEQMLPECPILLFSLLVFIFSLAGLPPTAGFITKLFILLELIKNGAYLLSFVFLLTSILAIYYYFRLTRPILKIIANRQDILSSERKIELRDVILKIILLICSLYLILSVFKPSYIFFM